MSKIFGIDAKWLLLGAAAYFLLFKPGNKGFALGTGGGSFGLGSEGVDSFSLSGFGDPAGSLTPSKEAALNAAALAQATAEAESLSSQLAELKSAGISDPLNVLKTGGLLKVGKGGLLTFPSGAFVGSTKSGSLIPASFLDPSTFNAAQKASSPYFISSSGELVKPGSGSENLSTCDPSTASCI